jgi:hemerythrin superfamily protein
MAMTLIAGETAVNVLTRDHDVIRDLFEEAEAAETDLRKKLVGDRCLREIEAHTRLEKKVFYPAVRRDLGENELVAQALAEHDAAQRLIDEMKELPAGERYNVRFRALREIILAHFEEEETSLLPLVENSDMDIEQLGAQLLTKRSRLAPRRPAEPGAVNVAAVAAVVGAVGAGIWLARRLRGGRRARA